MKCHSSSFKTGPITQLLIYLYNKANIICLMQCKLVKPFKKSIFKKIFIWLHWV